MGQYSANETGPPLRPSTGRASPGMPWSGGRFTGSTLFKLLPAGPERELQLLVVAPVGYPPPPNEAKSATVNRPYLITPGQGGCPPCWCLF